MILRLTRLPDTLKGPSDDVYHGRVPARARFLQKGAADALLQLESDIGHLVYTDIFRSPEASLLAVRTRRGVQRPAYSGHNYGLSFDIATEDTLATLGMDYKNLSVAMEAHGFYCHRRDLSDGSESWHWNWLGDDASTCLKDVVPTDHNTWKLAVEARIEQFYGHDFGLSPIEIQAGLAKLSLYHGAFDGKLGSLTSEAILAFQRSWGLTEDGIAGPITQRTLAYVSADRQID